MNLLLLISGNIDKLLNSNALKYDDTEIVKFDEKDISRPRFVINLINANNYNNVFFGTIENELQRFQIIMKILILLSHSKKGAIIDELGNQNKFNFLKLFFIEFPLLLIEVIASIFIIIYFYIKLPILKWLLRKS